MLFDIPSGQFNSLLWKSFYDRWFTDKTWWFSIAMLKNQRVLGIVENQWDQKPINQNNSDSVGVRSPFVANRRILHSQHFATQRTQRSHIPWGSYWKPQFWRIFCLFSSLQNEPWVPWIFENLAAWESLFTFSEILVCSKIWTCLMSFHVYI